jgi:hypothetical protein
MNVTVIFVRGDSLVDKVIDTVSQGIYSHVAIKILGGTLEALGIKDPEDKYPGVWLHDADKYTNDPNAVLVDVDLPNITGAENTARALIGKPYGYDSCVSGGIYDLTGAEVPSIIGDDCSQSGVLILREGGLDVMGDTPASCITPMDLYRILTKGGD